MKLSSIKSLVAMAGLSASAVSKLQENTSKFSFGDITAQDEPDGRSSHYVETFVGEDGHYSTVIYSDGQAEIHAGTGPDIDVNSPLGKEIIEKAKALLDEDDRVDFGFKPFNTQEISHLAGTQGDKSDLPNPELHALIGRAINHVGHEHAEVLNLIISDAYSMGYAAGHNKH